VRASPLRRTRRRGAFAPQPTRCAFQLGVPLVRVGSDIPCRSAGFVTGLPSRPDGLPFGMRRRLRQDPLPTRRFRTCRTQAQDAFDWLDSENRIRCLDRSRLIAIRPAGAPFRSPAAARLSRCGPPPESYLYPAAAPKRDHRVIGRCLLPIAATGLVVMSTRSSVNPRAGCFRSPRSETPRAQPLETTLVTSSDNAKLSQHPRT